jgi:hypothetical protein
MITRLIHDREGGYADHPHDRGGCTKYGITKRTLSEWRGREVTCEDVSRMEEAEARAILKRIYLEPWHLVEHPRLRELLFDCGVLHGVPRTRKWLQQALGVTVDGLIGPVTEQALRRADPYTSGGVPGGMADSGRGVRMMEETLRAGVWGAVAPDVHVLTTPDGFIDLWTKAGIIGRHLAPPNPLYLVCARRGSVIAYAVVNGERDEAWIQVGHHDTLIEGPTFGARPLAITAIQDGFRCWIVQDGTHVKIVDLSDEGTVRGRWVEPIPLPLGETTSQGIVDVNGGRPIWFHHAFISDPFLEMVKVGDILVGSYRAKPG